MNSFDKVTIFHYHLKPGGVTQVIIQSVVAILSNIPEVTQVTLVCGSSENSEKVIATIRESLGREPSGKTVTCQVIPELGYLQPEQIRSVDAGSVEEDLLRRYGGTLWWVHNYHLGKNPLFTRILLKTAETRPDQAILFHIHDFPECARFGNLSFLLDHVDLPLYPVFPNVRYGVINSRDRDVLIQAGLPEKTVFLLHDPVESLPDTAISQDAAKQALSAFAAGTGRLFHEKGVNLLYPVRTIRRKNVLEAALLTRLLPFRANLIVTLPGVSRKEKPYSDVVEECCRTGAVPGLWGTGADPLSPGFETVRAAADIVISSSVQEGFGYLFLNALQWRRPLLGRRLDILEGIGSVFKGYPHMFYSALAVPLEEKMSRLLRKMYENRIAVLKRYFHGNEEELLKHQIRELLKQEEIDFSYLSPGLQQKLLLKAEDTRYRCELRRNNQEILDTARNLLERTPPDVTPAIEEQYGLQSFARRMKAVFSSFHMPGSQVQWKTDRSIQETVLQHFISVDNIRLLFADPEDTSG